MSKRSTIPRAEIERLDQFYREGRLRAMASPHVHYDDPACPHPGCGHKLEWIDFKLELHGDSEGIYKPLVRSWWEGTGFAGRCPSCGGWVRFTTLGMLALDDDEAETFPQLPTNWTVNAFPTASVVRRMPKAKRDAIMEEAARIAEGIYRIEPSLSDFETF